MIPVKWDWADSWRVSKVCLYLSGSNATRASSCIGWLIWACAMGFAGVSSMIEWWMILPRWLILDWLLVMLSTELERLDKLLEVSAELDARGEVLAWFAILISFNPLMQYLILRIFSSAANTTLPSFVRRNLKASINEYIAQWWHSLPVMPLILL